jgi:FKBP-type peptidyl-prolyl cis-trans isomerase FkpA
MMMMGLAMAAALGAAACGDDSPTAPSGSQTPGVAFSQVDLRNGTGADAVNGRTMTVAYTGWLYEPSAAENKGRQFDASASFQFLLGGGRVIRGWDLGVVGMKVGGRRRLVIPPDLAYGSQGAGGVIPPNATLVFEVDLLNVQ